MTSKQRKFQPEVKNESINKESTIFKFCYKNEQNIKFFNLHLSYFTINPSKQSIFYIDIGVIAHAFPKKVAPLIKDFLHVFRAGWVALFNQLVASVYKFYFVFIQI